MKRTVGFLFILLAIMTSCKKDNDADPEVTYLEYFSDKSIKSIVPLNGEVWIESSSRCDTCYQMPHFSEPMQQLTKIRGKSFDSNPDFAYRRIFPQPPFRVFSKMHTSVPLLLMTTAVSGSRCQRPDILAQTFFPLMRMSQDGFITNLPMSVRMATLWPM